MQGQGARGARAGNRSQQRTRATEARERGWQESTHIAAGSQPAEPAEAGAVLQPSAGNKSHCHTHETGIKEDRRADLLLPQAGDSAWPWPARAWPGQRVPDSRGTTALRGCDAGVQRAAHTLVVWRNCSLLGEEGVRVQVFAPSD